MENFDIYGYIAILRRRSTAFILTASVFLVISVIFVASWSRYRSEATLQVLGADIPQGMTAPLGMTSTQMMQALASQRIEQIRQKVLSTSSLVDIITKFNLYASSRETKPIVDIVDAMRKKIKLELVTSDLSGGSAAVQKSAEESQLGEIAFTIKFTYSDPLSSQHVTNELVSRFIDEDLKERRSQAKETSTLLEAQIAALGASLSEQEKKISAFKSQHPSVRPETLLLNQQQIQMIQVSIGQLESQEQALERTEGDLRAQLAGTDAYSRVVADGQLLTTPAVQLKTLQAKYASMIGQYGNDHPDVVKMRHQIEALQAQLGNSTESAALRSQIADIRTSLAAATATNGPDHPDVQALRHQLEGLEGQLALAAHDPATPSDIKSDADNPAYLMLVAQINAAGQQEKSLKRQRAALELQLQQYQTAVAQTPGVEQEIAALSRDYDNAQLRLRELQEKKLTADMGEQMEQGRTGERLEVVNPPELPSHTTPPQILLLFAGIVVSFFGGCAGVAGAEILSRSVHGPRHLEDLTGEPPLVVVPHIYTPVERHITRRNRRRAGIGAAIVLVIAIVLFSEIVMPLDVLWSLIGNRVG